MMLLPFMLLLRLFKLAVHIVKVEEVGLAFRLMKNFFDVKFSNNKGVKGVDGLRVLDEVVYTIINHCDQPLEIVNRNLSIPSE